MKLMRLKDAHHWRVHLFNGAGRMINEANCIFETLADAECYYAEGITRGDVATADLEAWMDDCGAEVIEVYAYSADTSEH